MFCTLTVLAFQPESLFMLKICIIGSCFATYEVLLYAALISRKISAFSKLFPGLIISGVALYASTRMLQTAMFISLFVYGFEPMRHNPQDIALYWVGLLMCLALTALQMYTFVIYRGIWKSTMTKATIHSDAHAVPGVQAKDSPFQAKQVILVCNCHLQLEWLLSVAAMHSRSSGHVCINACLVQQNKADYSSIDDS